MFIVRQEKGLFWCSLLGRQRVCFSVHCYAGRGSVSPKVHKGDGPS